MLTFNAIINSAKLSYTPEFCRAVKNFARKETNDKIFNALIYFYKINAVCQFFRIEKKQKQTNDNKKTMELS